VEKYIKGKDYRILVVGDKVVAAAERKPPMIVGDGVSTIAELVEQENNNPLRGVGHERPLTKIYLDEISQEYLARLEMRLDDIPSPGQIVCLRENGNLSTGGRARDCTNEIHPRNRELAVRAAKAIGLDVAGIDVIAENISD
jgi:cyanophycin synthetase